MKSFLFCPDSSDRGVWCPCDVFQWINELGAPAALFAASCVSLPLAWCSGSFQAAKFNPAPASCWRWKPWLTVTLSSWLSNTSFTMASVSITFNCLSPLLLSLGVQKSKLLKTAPTLKLYLLHKPDMIKWNEEFGGTESKGHFGYFCRDLWSRLCSPVGQWSKKKRFV